MPTDRTIAPLTALELRTLSEYATLHGHRWKAALLEDWLGARAVGTLQSLRNTRGPRWLAGFKLEAERPAVELVTPAQIAGEIRCVSFRHQAIEAGDECSECGVRLRPLAAAFLADCGRYCSRRCAEAHAAFLADVLNNERRRDVDAFKTGGAL